MAVLVNVNYEGIKAPLLALIQGNDVDVLVERGRGLRKWGGLRYAAVTEQAYNDEKAIYFSPAIQQPSHLSGKCSLLYTTKGRGVSLSPRPFALYCGRAATGGTTQAAECCC